MLRVCEVSKRYKTTVAVNNASFDVRPGQVLGLLGPNGAGKSSILRMVTNITWPDTGEISLDGERVNQATQSRIGYMPEERGLYRQMGVLDQLVYLGRLKGLATGAARKAADYWLRRLEAQDWAAKRPRDLSRGMQQKVQFALTLIHSPRLVILDEPFSGLDPLNSQLMEDVIRERRAQGDIVLFASHLMEQVEGICDEICLIAEGEVLVSGELQAVKQAHGRDLVQVAFDGDDGFLSRLEQQGSILIESRKGDQRRIRLGDGASADMLLDAIRAAGRSVRQFSFRHANLREVFIDRVRASRAALKVDPLPEKAK